MKDNGGPAFPFDNAIDGWDGMSLRDWFAGMVLQGDLANPSVGFETPETAAKSAYEQADAMIAERGKE